MERFDTQLRNSIVSLLMVAFIMMPSLVKLSHALNEHKHFECKTVGKLHIHKLEMGCDFQKFNLSPQIFKPLTVVLGLFTVDGIKKQFSPYSFLNKYQKLNFTLRGPPLAL